MFVPSQPDKIHQEAVQGGAAVSESILATIAATANFILDNFTDYSFGVSGASYSSLLTPYTFAASQENILYKCVIEKITVFNEVSGLSGNTEFRIERQLAAGGAWTTIFSQNGVIANTAADSLYFESTDLMAPSGVTLPILSTLTLEQNDKLRFVLVSAASGAQNLFVRVVARPTT